MGKSTGNRKKGQQGGGSSRKSASNVPETGNSNAQAHKLCDDLLSRVFLRLPIKSLKNQKLVCKDWNSLIRNPSFRAQFRAQKSTEVERATGVLVSLKGGHEVAFVPFENTTPSHLPLRYEGDTFIRIKESCNGLVCCYTGRRNQRFVYEPFGGLLVHNPTTQQFRRIPLPNFEGFQKDSVEATTLVFDPQVSPDYKILLVYLSAEKEDAGYGDFEIQFELYNSRTVDWERALPPTVVRYIVFGLGVYWNGTIYWPSSMYDGLLFNVEEKTLGSFPMPPAREFEDYLAIKYFGECGGHLYLILLNGLLEGDKFEVYEMDNNVWSMKYVADLKELCEDAHPICISMETNEEDSKFLVVIKDNNSIIRYNFKDGTTVTLCDATTITPWDVDDWAVAGIGGYDNRRPGVLHIDSLAAV